MSPNNSRRPAHRRAFSLVELVVVMVIIGMLASIATLSYQKYQIAAKRNKARAEIATLVKAIETFYADTGRYPTEDEGLDILVLPTKNYENFMNKIPKDPWGNPYEYRRSGKNRFVIVSFGDDGKEGGETDGADITSDNLE